MGLGKILQAIFGIGGPIAGAGVQQAQSEAANDAVREMQNQAYGRAQTMNQEQWDAAIANRDSALAAVTGNSLVPGYQKRSADALAAITGQRADAAGAYRALMDTIRSRSQGLTDAEKAATERDYANAESAGVQSLVDSGLYNTSARGSLAVSTARDKNQAMNAIDEQFRKEQLGFEADIGQAAINADQKLGDQYLETLLNTTGDTLGAGDAETVRYLQTLLGGNASILGQMNTNAERELGIIQAPYAQPSGPPPPNWGDALSAVGNNLASYRAAAYKPPSNQGAILGGAGISAGGQLGGTAILASVLKSLV